MLCEMKKDEKLSFTAFAGLTADLASPQQTNLPHNNATIGFYGKHLVLCTTISFKTHLYVVRSFL